MFVCVFVKSFNEGKENVTHVVTRLKTSVADNQSTKDITNACRLTL